MTNPPEFAPPAKPAPKDTSTREYTGSRLDLVARTIVEEKKLEQKLKRAHDGRVADLGNPTERAAYAAEYLKDQPPHVQEMIMDELHQADLEHKKYLELAKQGLPIWQAGEEAPKPADIPVKDWAHAKYIPKGREPGFESVDSAPENTETRDRLEVEAFIAAHDQPVSSAEQSGLRPAGTTPKEEQRLDETG